MIFDPGYLSEIFGNYAHFVTNIIYDTREIATRNDVHIRFSFDMLECAVSPDRVALLLNAESSRGNGWW